MKKFTLLTGFLVLFLMTSAQKSWPESIRLSFSAHPSLNWMSSGLNVISRGKATAGFDFGLNADLFFDTSERYALTTGLLISNTGGELDFYSPNNFAFAGESIKPGSSIRYRLQYLEIPMAVKLKTSHFQRWTYWGQFGISSFINIGAKGDSSDGLLDKNDINKEVNLFNLAMNIGAGGEFDLGSGNALVIGLIYKNGFLDVTTDNAFDEKTTVNSLNLKVGLLF